MVWNDDDRLTSEITELLEQEALALKQACFSDLAELAHRKEALIRQGAEAGLSQDSIKRIKHLTRRNAALMEGSMRGLSAAMHRLETLKDPAIALNTYDGSGRRQALVPGSMSNERRA